MLKKEKQISFNNLLDFCIAIETDSSFTGNGKDFFIRILKEYFFKKETDQNKSFEIFLSDFPVPDFLKDLKSPVDADIEEITNAIEGDSVNNSLSGKIMMSQQYLKAFYPHHTPNFMNMPEDIRSEIIARVREKNSLIITAFEKAHQDKQTDTSRKILTLVALIIKNIQLKTGRPLNNQEKGVNEIISSIFLNSDEVFTASQQQIADLNDDKKIKDTIKQFFIIKQFKEISDIAALFKEEVNRFIKRTKSSAGRK